MFNKPTSVEFVPCIKGLVLAKFQTYTFQSGLIRYMTLMISQQDRKYLTNLVSVGIVWYQQCIKYSSQYNFSIIVVSSRYSSDGFLSVWYQSQYNLVIFAKLLILSSYCISDNKYFIYLTKRPILEKAHLWVSSTLVLIKQLTYKLSLFSSVKH